MSFFSVIARAKLEAIQPIISTNQLITFTPEAIQLVSCCWLLVCCHPQTVRFGDPADWIIIWFTFSIPAIFNISWIPSASAENDEIFGWSGLQTRLLRLTPRNDRICLFDDILTGWISDLFSSSGAGLLVLPTSSPVILKAKLWGSSWLRQIPRVFNKLDHQPFLILCIQYL